MTVDRASHQPERSFIAPPDPTACELERACGESVVLVLAIDPSTTPIVVQFEDPDKPKVTCSSEAVANGAGTAQEARAAGVPRPLQIYEGEPAVVHAVRCALGTHVAAVRVAAGGGADQRMRVKQAVAKAFGDSPETPVDVVSFDPEASEAARREWANFELMGLPAGALALGRDLLAEHPAATSLIIMESDQVRVAPQHLKELCDRFHEKPGADVVTSWVVWLRRTPVLVSREFVEGIDESPLARVRESGVDRPVPQLKVEEVVFGEEKFAANGSVPADVEAFFAGKPTSLLEAVRGARSRAKEAAGKSERDQPAAAAADDKKSNAQLLLDRTVEAALARMNAIARGDLADRLARVDAAERRSKADFPIFATKDHAASLVYLDSAATSQRLGCALEAQYRFDAYENANVYRGAYELSAKATATLNDARGVLERFINADRRQTIYTQNTTMSANLVAHAWGLRNVGSGDLIVVPISEHHSNLLPWRILADAVGAQIAYIPILPDGRLDLDAYDKLLARKPKLVCVAHVSNVIGIRNPVEDMAARAHAVGARFFLDAAQSFAHLPIDVKELGADFVAFSAHKCYGPTGIGGVWIAPDAFDEMDPTGSGGGAISHVSEDSYYLRVGAIQYELGTPAVSLAVGFAAALDHMSLIGMDAVREHDRALTEYLVAGLEGIDGVTVWGDHSRDDGKMGLVSFSIAGTSPSEVGAFLGKLGVAVRSGGHCALPLSASMGVVGTTRASIAVHTTREDIDALVAGVMLCRDLYAHRFEEPNPDRLKKLATKSGRLFGADGNEAARGRMETTEPKPEEGTRDTDMQGSVTDLAADARVREHYADVALSILRSLDPESPAGRSSCCEPPVCAGEAQALYAAKDISHLPGGALAASRGCGDPVAKANLAPGERVLDLGSGGGIDALIAARVVGSDGRVYGVDMTEDMIELARRNAADAGCDNVEFLHGSIEDIPLPDGSVDVVLSNCVINFSNDKPRVFREACRVLAAHGRMVVSDIVAFDPLPAEADAVEALCTITGCTNGIMQAKDYERMIRAAGFEHVRIEPKTRYTLDVLREKAERKGRMEAYARIDGRAAADGVCGSVIIFAEKR